MKIDELIEERAEKLKEIQCQDCGGVFLGAPDEENLICEEHPI